MGVPEVRTRSRAAHYLPFVLAAGIAGWGVILGLVVARSGANEPRETGFPTASARASPSAMASSSEVVATALAPARELERMLSDRPAMRTVLESRPSLGSWIERELGETSELARVEWDADLPRSGQPSEYELGRLRAGARSFAEAQSTKLRISGAYSGVDQVGLVIYELLNRRNAKALSEAWGDAMSGKVGRDAFALAATRIEHRALVALRSVCEAHALVPGPTDVVLARALEAPLDFEAYLAWSERLHRAERVRYDPLSYWRRAYETRGAP